MANQTTILLFTVHSRITEDYFRQFMRKPETFSLLLVFTCNPQNTEQDETNISDLCLYRAR